MLLSETQMSIFRANCIIPATTSNASSMIPALWKHFGWLILHLFLVGGGRSHGGAPQIAKQNLWSTCR